MDKKGTLSTIVWVAILMIFLIVILLLLFGEGLLPRIAKSAENMADSSLAGLRNDKFTVKDSEADKEILEYYQSLVNDLKSQSGTCQIKDESLPYKFRGYKISLSKVQDGTFVELINKDGQRIRTNTIAECVITKQIILKT